MVDVACSLRCNIENLEVASSRIQLLSIDSKQLNNRL